jgi:hypothetical protein
MGGEDQEDCSSRPAWLKVNETPSQLMKTLGVVVSTCDPNYLGSTNRRTVVQASLGIK